MFRWYVVNTYSGHENKVKQNLEHRIVSLGQQRAVRAVVVPTEAVSEMKDNQKVTVEKRTMPGYVLVNMELDEDSWTLVKGTPGVTGFVGASNEPVPLTQMEVDRLLKKEVAVRERTRAELRDRRGDQGRLRPARGLLRRDLRDQRGRRRASRCWYQSSGARHRSKSASTRSRSSKEDDDGQESSHHDQAAGDGRRRLPAPPVGPALGQHGINIMEFCKAFNAQTQQDSGTVIPVVITVYEDRSFTFITKTPPAADLIRKALSLDKGSPEPHRQKVGKITEAQLRTIAEQKFADLNANDLDAATKIVAGTARSMGVDVV